MNPGIWHLLAAAGLNPEKTGNLAERFRSSSSALDPLATIRSLPDLTDAARTNMERVDLAKVAQCHAAGLQVAQPDHFPEILAEIQRPPAFLFTWGDQSIWHRPCVAIVGTRNATSYGLACAQKFGEHLASAGVTVVSGGAFGIDGAAHKGALSAGGKTLAVLAHGLDTARPASHTALFNEIRASGLLVSSYAVGTPSLGHHFIARNTLIAALSTAVLVIEAPKESGALHTAEAAAEFGRNVYVIPGPIVGSTFWGSHNLIRNGATLVDHPGQILDDLGQFGDFALPERESEASETQSLVLSAIEALPKPIEKIIEATGLDADAVMAELTMLELEGAIQRVAGGYAIKI